MLRKLLIVWLALGAVAFAQPQNAARQDAAPNNADWTRPFPPFRIIGNIYWVGSYDLSTYLITTPQGNILINTGVGDTAQQIKASVEQLGFKITDTKILISERDKDLLETGGKTDFRWGNVPSAQFEPVKVDQTFKDGETIALGGTVLTAHLNAGHTKGATSFTLNVREGGKTYRVIIANMGSINPGVKVSGMPSYPGITQDYANT